MDESDGVSAIRQRRGVADEKHKDADRSRSRSRQRVPEPRATSEESDADAMVEGERCVFLLNNSLKAFHTEYPIFRCISLSDSIDSLPLVLCPQSVRIDENFDGRFREFDCFIHKFMNLSLNSYAQYN
ncbi:unnamed protein product [Anisakis simplex]|uniref:Uncharacterized protein n=1 Tax=Anisakis simplex TaxID=6269 RepID=A0A0M3JH34_ANISI|nr:unnamed protein product [Anisakis simplex]